MHHGTILYDSDLDMVSQVLRADPEKIQAKGVRSVRARVTTVRAHMPHPVPLEQFQVLLLQEISKDRPMEPYSLTESDLSAVEAIKKARKYVKPDYDPIVVVACSSAEYGETLNRLKVNEVYVKETAALLPLHPYGVSKVGQDLLSFQYFMNDHIRCIRARIFNSTGTRKVNDVTSDFTKRAAEAEKSGAWELRVGNLETHRAIMDQRDLVNGLMLLAEKGKAGDVYNLSSEFIYQMKDIVSMIEKQVGHRFRIYVDPALLRPADEKIIAGDITKLKRDTGWKQKIPMEQTIADMLDYWRSH